MRHSLYWDDFERRIKETVACLKTGVSIPVRRVAVFITERCNMRCSYCNVDQQAHSMDIDTFRGIIDKYGKSAIIHITGGEPGVVPWLYPYLEEQAYRHGYRFHLNTNMLVPPPAQWLGRLKVSLDSHLPDYWNSLVGVNAFDKVVANIQKAIPQTVTSITCTLTRENFWDASKFVKFTNKTFPGLYAIFFSIYKGTDERFAFRDSDVENFFEHIIPDLRKHLPEESLRLMEETLDEKQRLLSGVRFPQNTPEHPCYISMSARVFDSYGNESWCSHLYRDGIRHQAADKHVKCLYGCNRRLVAFNEAVEQELA